MYTGVFRKCVANTSRRIPEVTTAIQINLRTCRNFVKDVRIRGFAVLMDADAEQPTKDKWHLCILRDIYIC